jgi:hypothetical protein
MCSKGCAPLGDRCRVIGECTYTSTNVTHYYNITSLIQYDIDWSVKSGEYNYLHSPCSSTIVTCGTGARTPVGYLMFCYAIHPLLG